MGQQQEFRQALDKVKYDIIKAIEAFMSARNLDKVKFTTTRMEPFSDDDENAFMREVISLDSKGNVTYDVPDFGDTDEKSWNDADFCPYSLNWILSELEAGNYYQEEDEEDEN